MMLRAAGVVRQRQPLLQKENVMKATGWAVCAGDKILVPTVSPERRAAIVNWLVTERAILVLDVATNDEIEKMWQTKKGKAECCKVEISAPAAT